MDNKIAFDLSADDLQKINDALKVVFDTLKPHTVVLSDQDRKNLPKMADGTFPFVKKVLSYMETNPEFTPNFVNESDFSIDLNGYQLGNQLLSNGYRLTRILEDISMLSGSEAYMAALAYFNNVKYQTKMNQAGQKLFMKIYNNDLLQNREIVLLNRCPIVNQ